jgi:hypothetical protein
MKRSQILVVCLSIATGYIVATALNRPSAGQPARPEPIAQEGQVWRYQVMGAGEGGYPNLVLTDTVTGRVWIRSSNPKVRDEWNELGSPASPAVK